MVCSAHGHTCVRTDLCLLGRFFSRSHVVFLCSLAELLTAIRRQPLRIRADALCVGCSCVSFFCEYSRALLLGNKPNLPGTSGDLEAGSEPCLVEHSLLLVEAGLLRAQPWGLVTCDSRTVVQHSVALAPASCCLAHTCYTLCSACLGHARGGPGVFRSSCVSAPLEHQFLPLPPGWCRSLISGVFVLFPRSREESYGLNPP